MTVAQPELIRQVRRALASLHDPAAMRSHPLALLVGSDSDHASPGATLRQQLLEAIDALQPEPHVDPRGRAWRAYRILQQRYVNGLDAVSIQRELAMSKSQFYREHENAVAALAVLLLERAPRTSRTETSALCATETGPRVDTRGRAFPGPASSGAMRS